MVRYFQQQKYVIIKLISLIGQSSVVVELVVQFWLSFGSIYTVVLGGSIGDDIALRGICVVQEQKYFGTRLILFVISGMDSRSRYFVRSIAVDFCSLYLHFSLNIGQFSYFESQLLLAIVSYITILLFPNCLRVLFLRGY